MMYLTPLSRYICGTWISKYGRDRCDGNIKMKLNDEHEYALIVDLKVRILRVMSTSGFVNTILRIRNFIIRSVITSTSKTICTNFSKYGHW